MVDLRQFKVQSAAGVSIRMELKNPGTDTVMRDDAGQAYYIDHLGKDSKEVSKLSKKHLNEALERQRKNKGQDIDAITDENSEELAAATTGWYLPPLDEQELAFSRDAALKLYRDPEFVWIPEQLLKSWGDRKAFLTKAASN